MKGQIGAAMVLSVLTAWAAAAGAAQPSRTSLWKVSSPGRTLYITGTTQLLTKLDYPLPKPIIGAFAESHGLLIAANPGANGKGIAALLKARGTLPPGETLQDTLSPDQQKTLEKALHSLEIPPEKVEHLKPWLATLEITRAALGQLGITPAQGEAQHFYDQAKKRDMPIRFLETASGQIRYFAALPEALQRQWLMLQIQGLDKVLSARGEVVSAWRHGDTETLVKLIHGTLAGHPKLYQALITHRNDKWEKMLRARLEHRGPPLFVLLGIGNLIGGDGLIARLRADGYTVEQL